METNWLTILKNHLIGIKGAGWTDENLTTIDALIDTLGTLIGTIDAATTDSLHGKLGTDTELADYSFYDLLGGNAFKTNALSAMLGALTATNNLKGILGAYTTAANLKAAIDTIKAQTDKIANMPPMDFWSANLESITLTDIAAPGTDVALPDVVVDLPAGATVVRAVAMFMFRMLDNPGAANALQGDQHIGVQKGGGGGYLDAIFLDDNMFGIAEATREGGTVVIGGINVVAKVDGDETYNLQWTASLVDVADLKFCDVQTGLRIWYSV